MPKSQSEVRLAHAVMSGTAKNAPMDRAYAAEVVDKMHGKQMSSLPKRVRSKIGRPKR